MCAGLRVALRGVRDGLHGGVRVALRWHELRAALHHTLRTAMQPLSKSVPQTLGLRRRRRSTPKMELCTASPVRRNASVTATRSDESNAAPRRTKPVVKSPIESLRIASVLALLGAAGCQPPVVEAHIAPTPPASPTPDAEQDKPRPGSLSVTGHATLDVTPDTADIKLDLSSLANSPRAAVAKLRKSEAAMRANLEAEGIESDEVVVSMINLAPKHRWDVHRERQILLGYEATLCVTVSTKDFVEIPAIIEAGAKAGVTQSSTRFRSTEMTALKRRVREMALDAAKAKAEQFRESLDFELARVTSVGETQAGAAWSTYGLNLDNITANATGFVAGAPSAVQAQTLPLSLTVAISYELG